MITRLAFQLPTRKVPGSNTGSEAASTDFISPFTNKKGKAIPLQGRRWEDNIKMDLQEVGGGCGDWM